MFFFVRNVGRSSLYLQLRKARLQDCLPDHQRLPCGNYLGPGMDFVATRDHGL